ncbi:MAG: DUF935 family protein [Verrucomicrobiota bacterium]
MTKTTNPESLLSPSVLRSWKLYRFNPIKNLRPETLARHLDNFEAGELRDVALLFHHIAERDDVLKVVIPKRKGAVARQGWHINVVDDSRAAKRQKDALEFFYNNITTRHATDLDVQGGFRLLIRQMMDAVGLRYAAHEIVWKPGPHGMAAEFRYVPLWFFESKTGKLRFKNDFNKTDGEEMEPGGWMVTVGPGLMISCAIAYLFKIEPLKDWLMYSSRNGMPGVRGVTDASPDTPEWEAARQAVADFGAEFSALMSRGTEIESIDLTAQGTLPYPELVERMDRAMATMWRGADLSTISKGEGMGASLQQEESDILLEDDVEMINETLNTQVDRYVIDYVFGEGVEQLAYVEVEAPDRLDEKAEQEKMHLAAQFGVPIPIDTYAEKLSLGYDASKVEMGAILMHPAAPAAVPVEDEEELPPEEASNAARSVLEKAALQRAWENDMAELLGEVDKLAAIEDEDELISAMETLRERLPALIERSAGGQTAKVIETFLTTHSVEEAVKVYENALKTPST